MKNKRIYATVLAIIGLIILIIVACNIFPKKEQKEILNKDEGKIENLQESKEINIFEEFYDIAKEKVDSMTIDEKIGQVLLVRYPEKDQIEILKKYEFRRIFII